VTKKQLEVDPVTLGEVIDMALSDHVSFSAIKELFGLNENQVKTIMRAHLRPARYEAWRTRIQTFGDRRETYKADPIEKVRKVVATDPADHELHPEPPPRKSEPSKRSLSQF
jgi:uncharacterized protein (TIGR03643 family)